MPKSFLPFGIAAAASLFAVASMAEPTSPAVEPAAPSVVVASASRTESAPRRVRRTQPTYKVEVGLEGEVFPAFANFASLQKASDRKWGTVEVTVTNSTDHPILNHVSVEFAGWSDKEIQIISMRAGEKRTLIFAPTFLERFFLNKEIAAATAMVTVTDSAGREVFATTEVARLRPVGDMYWGKQFKYAPFIASWVTPHEEKVEAVLTRAKEHMPGRRLPGYEPQKSEEAQEKSTVMQARAIYKALQELGVSYVKSSKTFGGHKAVAQRIRRPKEALGQLSANCIDGAVMYASLFENLDMDPVVIVVPGHAYVGVRVARHSDRFLYIETSLTGRATFEASLEAASKGMSKFKASQVTRIDIAEARERGIYPLP